MRLSEALPNGEAHDLHESEGNCPIYQYIRDFDGICGTLTSAHGASFWKENKMQSLGYWVDSYLKSHGYNNDAIVHITTAFTKSDSPHQFANYLSLKGMAMTERMWLWGLIHSYAGLCT